MKRLKERSPNATDVCIRIGRATDYPEKREYDMKKKTASKRQFSSQVTCVLDPTGSIQHVHPYPKEFRKAYGVPIDMGSSRVTQQHPINGSIDCRFPWRKIHPEPLLKHPSNLSFRDRVQIGRPENILDASLEFHIGRCTRAIVHEL